MNEDVAEEEALQALPDHCSRWRASRAESGTSKNGIWSNSSQASRAEVHHLVEDEGEGAGDDEVAEVVEDPRPARGHLGVHQGLGLLQLRDDVREGDVARLQADRRATRGVAALTATTAAARSARRWMANRVEAIMIPRVFRCVRLSGPRARGNAARAVIVRRGASCFSAASATTTHASHVVRICVRGPVVHGKRFSSMEFHSYLNVTDFVEVDFFHRDIAELRDTSPRNSHGIQLGNESDVKPECYAQVGMGRRRRRQVDFHASTVKIDE